MPPPPPILDPATLDPGKLEFSREQIYEVLPQRYEFAQLDGILVTDKELGIAAGIRHVRPDEWWCRGHMPNHPIFPGVLMLECGAQLAAFTQHVVMPVEGDAFMGFGGIEGAKFRGSVIPPSQVIIIGRVIEKRSRRFVCEIQSFVDNVLVFEGRIAGIRLKT